MAEPNAVIKGFAKHAVTGFNGLALLSQSDKFQCIPTVEC